MAESVKAVTGSWSKLLDVIAFGILNWKSTLRGFLSIYIYIFLLLTSVQFTQTTGAQYAKWFLASGLVAKAITAWLSSDKSGSSATGFSFQAGTITLPDPPPPVPDAAQK